jgi:hypothetical protein
MMTLPVTPRGGPTEPGRWKESQLTLHSKYAAVAVSLRFLCCSSRAPAQDHEVDAILIKPQE